jgi:hypothetical protein
MEPSIVSQTGPRTARPLNTQRPPSTASGGSGTQTQATTGTGPRLRVANTGGTGLRLRTGPSRSAQVAAVLPEGTVLEIIGPDAQGDGLTWKNVRAPGDGRGYVAADYVTAVANAAPATTTSPSTASTVPASNTTTASSPPSSSAASSTTANSTASTPASSTPSDVLKVDVSVKSNEVKTGGDQTVTVTVTKDGQPVSGAQVTIKTSPTGETPAAPATDGSGKTTVTWKPTGSAGFIGVGVSVLSSDGMAGVGGASFRLT